MEGSVGRVRIHSGLECGGAENKRRAWERAPVGPAEAHTTNREHLIKRRERVQAYLDQSREVKGR